MKFFLKSFSDGLKFLCVETARERKRIVLRYLQSFQLGNSYFHFRRQIVNGQYHAISERLDGYWSVASKAKDVRFMTAIWLIEERLGKYLTAIQHEYFSFIVDRGDSNNLRDIGSNDRILVRLKESRKEGIGNGILFLGLVLELSESFESIVVLVDERLIKIWRRSLARYPKIEVVSEVDFLALGDLKTINLTELKYLLIKNESKIVNVVSHRQLTVDQQYFAMSQEFMKRGFDDLPLVGLVWRSSNRGKESPDFGQWLNVIKNFSAVYVLLQYGVDSDEVQAFEEVAQMSGSKIYRGVEDLSGDLDKHFAEIAAVDVVLTIPSSVAYFATALGVESIILVDPGYSRQFPINSDFCPWHPKATIIRPPENGYKGSMRRALEVLQKF